MGDVIIGWD